VGEGMTITIPRWLVILLATFAVYIAVANYHSFAASVPQNHNYSTGAAEKLDPDLLEKMRRTHPTLELDEYGRRHDEDENGNLSPAARQRLENMLREQIDRERGR
jgi:hypothetical protein